jgi:hypothetical protein
VLGKVNLINLIGIMGDGVELGPLSTAATNRPIVPAPGDSYDGEIGGMIGRGNRCTLRKPPPMPIGGMIGRGNRCTRRKPPTSSTTNLTCCPDVNPGHRGGSQRLTA